MRQLFVTFVVGFFVIKAAPVRAFDLTVSDQFTATTSPYNVAQGLSYLPDGDALALTSDFVNGPSLIRVDANGDGLPLGGQKILAQFDPSSFGSFVQTAPGGQFALLGLTGAANAIYRVDLVTEAVTGYFSSPGNFDLVFVDDSHAYVSANPGGFDPSVPNEISYVVLNDAPLPQVVAQVANVPSGAIALDGSGNLAYLRGTYQFPAPPASTTFLIFPAAKLADALANTTVLTDADANSVVTLNGGYDLVYHSIGSGVGEYFISTIGNDILRLASGQTSIETFLLANDPAAPSFTTLSMFHPSGLFDASGPADSKLGVALATNFFSEFSLVQVWPTTFDTDGDSVIDSADKCPNDAAKSAPGVCGCGVADIDLNADGILDCGGAPKTFSTVLEPEIASATVQGKAIRLKLEKLGDTGLIYRIELKKLGKKGSKKVFETKKTSIKIRGLAKGKYTVRYRVVQKIRKKRIFSRFSNVSSLNV